VNNGLPLRDYQVAALDAVRDAYRKGVQRQLLALPTGAGKTVILGTLAARAHDKSGWRVLILAHRDELITQAVDKLCMVRPELAMSIGVVKASRDEWQKDVVVASVQSLHRKRLERIPRDSFDLIVVDEAHHAAADTYQAILRWFGGLDPLDEGPAPKRPMVLGVTATPERADSKSLADTWQDVVYHRSILDMIREGYLCDAKGVAVQLDMNLDDVKQSRGDYQDGALGAALEAAEAPRAAAAAYMEHAKGRKAIVFTPTVALSEQMRDEFQAWGVACEHLDGTTPQDERRGILHRLSTGETQVVTNCGVLTEGFDEPSVSCIIMARPTRSRVLYVQCVGRGFRLHPDKAPTGPTPGLLVIDLMGNTTRHSLVGVPKLVADQLEAEVVEAMEVEGLSVEEAIDRQNDWARQGRLVAKQIDLFKRSAVNWQQVSATRWTLGGVLVVQMDTDGRWSAAHRTRDSERTLGSGLDVDYARGLCEDYARKHRMERLVDPKAEWRALPASQSQRRALWALGERGLSRRGELTRGEASDAIDVAQARKP
jgi:superfamily II DNA or RNA helicase